MKTLSTGQHSTLGNYRVMASALWGESSRAVAFLDKKIADSPNGADEEVIAHEIQVFHLLTQIEYGPEIE